MPEKKEPKVRRFETMETFIKQVGGTPRTDEHRAAHARLRSLEARIRTAIGQLVVYVERDERSMVLCGRSSRHDYHIVTRYKIGVLEKPGLILQATEGEILERRVALACARHVVVHDDRSMKLVDGPIWEDCMWPFFRGLGVPMRLRNPLYAHDDRYSRIEVIAGTEQVYAWTKRAGHELMLWEAARLLNMPVDFPALTERLEKERIYSTKAISDLWHTYEALQEKIERLRRSIDNDLVDEVFVALASHDDREQLSRTRAQLCDHLKKLKELGLHERLPNIHLIRHVAQQLGVELT